MKHGDGECNYSNNSQYQYKFYLVIKANFNLILYMVLDYLNGVMVKNMKVIGKIIKCMVKENSDGQMEDYIKENINMIKKMDKENLLQMKIQDIKVAGRMENNMEKEF